MVYKVELIPISEGNQIIIKENEKIIAGRGSSLGCNDKKISRQHAELLLKKDQTLWIKPTHTNPVFYRPLNGKTTHLTKDVEQELKDGDQIGLLPTSFFFRISYSTDMNNNKDESSSKPTSSDIESTSASTSSMKDQDQSKSTDEDQKSRTLPTWMSSSTSNDRSSSKRQLSSEDDNKTTTKESSDTSDKQSSAMKSFDDNSDESFDSVSPKKLKTSDKPRPVCSYGASCYRKNPTHRTEQSHPGDSDYEDEKEIKDNTKDNIDADKPQCPYGKTCYRQNPQHKHDYKH